MRSYDHGFWERFATRLSGILWWLLAGFCFLMLYGLGAYRVLSEWFKSL